MDKVFHFQTQKGKAGHLQQVISSEQKLQFYSEEEFDSANDTPQAQNNLVGMNFCQFVSDDGSESGTPTGQERKFTKATKMSKFKVLVNTQRNEGDNEDEPSFGSNDNQFILEEQKNQEEEPQYNIEEQEERLKQKLKEKESKMSLKSDPKLISKGKNTQSHQVISVNSEIEKGAKKVNDKLGNHPFRHLIYGTTINDLVYKKFLILTQRGLIYARKCLKGPSDKFIKSKQVILPEAPVKKEKALILDLDETLIHSCPPRENPQVYVTAVGELGEEAKIGINIRPYCSLFLQKLSALYTIYIYTASSAAYANAIIKYLDPKKQYISGALTRQNCMETKNGFFIKDLRIIANKQLKDMLIVDNLAHSFGFQIENGIPILEFHNDQNDTELKYMIDYLTEAAKHNDLREFNKRLRLDDLIEFSLDE